MLPLGNSGVAISSPPAAVETKSPAAEPEIVSVLLTVIVMVTSETAPSSFVTLYVMSTSVTGSLKVPVVGAYIIESPEMKTSPLLSS